MLTNNVILLIELFHLNKTFIISYSGSFPDDVRWGGFGMEQGGGGRLKLRILKQLTGTDGLILELAVLLSLEGNGGIKQSQHHSVLHHWHKIIYEGSYITS